MLRLLVAAWVGSGPRLAAGFQLDVDLNTYTASELQQASQAFGAADGSWSITVNSPDTTSADWSSALAAIGTHAYSEDNPDQYGECQRVHTLAGGKFVAAMQYHETGGTPATMLSAAEIDDAAAKCGCGIILLTRAWTGDWKTKVESVLGHPMLYAVAMELNPLDATTRADIAPFIIDVIKAGHAAYILLPFRTAQGNSEEVITKIVQQIKNGGAPIGSSLVHLVVARYDQPHLPIIGPTNTIQSAFLAALGLRADISQNTTAAI